MIFSFILHFYLTFSYTVGGCYTYMQWISFKQEPQRCMLTGLLWTTEKLTRCLPVMESYLTMKVRVEVWNQSRSRLSCLCIGSPVKPAIFLCCLSHPAITSIFMHNIVYLIMSIFMHNVYFIWQSFLFIPIKCGQWKIVRNISTFTCLITKVNKCTVQLQQKSFQMMA